MPRCHRSFLASSETLDRRLMPSAWIAPVHSLGTDPLPSPEPPPGSDPGTSTPIITPPIPPSGPIGPGTS